MYELAGRIALNDAFSAPLASMERKANAARQAVDALGSTADTRLSSGVAAGAATATGRIEQLRARFEDLKRRMAAPLEVRTSARPVEQLGGALQRAGQEAQGAIQGIGALTSSLGGMYTAVVGSAVVVGALKFGRLAVELAQASAAAQTVELSFRNLAASAGLNSATLLREMRRASRGTVDEVTLMIAANRALLAGGSEFASALPGLFEVARAAALTTGQDVGYVFETLTRGIAKASPLLIDNAEIYIKTGRALEEYAAAQGKTVEMLSAIEQRAAMANIVLEQGGRFIRDMGLDATTAADQMQNLPAAWRDLKIAIGDVVVDTGLPAWLAALAEVVRQITVTGRGAGDLQARIDELRFLGKTKEADRFAAALARFKEVGRVELQPGELPSQAASRWYSEQIALVDRAILAARGYTDEQVRQAAAAREAAAAQEALTDAMAPYTKALNEYRSSKSGAAALMEDLGALTGRLEAARSGMSAPLPDMGGTLWADTAALRAWLEALQTSDGALEASRQATLRVLDATDAWQLSQLRALLAMDNNVVALQLLAEALLGPGQGVDDLARAFAKLPPEAQLAATQLGLFDVALARIQERASAGVTVEMRLSGYESALGELDQIAISLAGALPADEIVRFRNRMRDDFTQHWRQMGDIDEFGMALQKAIIVGGYRDIAGQIRARQQEVERDTARHIARVGKSAGEISSAIERALRVGLEVTPEDIMLTEAGLYQDKALEAARRLDAVLQGGFDTLRAHPDWAELLKVPPDVLAGSEAGLKAWAAATRADVADLARPDLINWDAFLVNFQRGLDRDAAKRLTIDLAVEKLHAAGMLGGMSDEERSRRVAEALGLEAPALTIDALFTPQPGAKMRLVADLLEGLPALEVPTQLAPLPEVTPPRLPAGSGVDIAGPLLLPTQVELPPAQLLAAGIRAADVITTAFVNQMAVVDVGAATLGAWATQFAGVQPMWEQIGQGAGNTVARGFVRAVKEGVGELRADLAALIAPEVAEILRREERGRRSSA